MKKTKLTRSLLAACSIVALSAVMYGCVHSGDDEPEAPPVTVDPPTPTPIALPELPEGDFYGLAEGVYTVMPGAYGGYGHVWISCADDGPACVVTVDADGNATASPDSGMVEVGLVDDAQDALDAQNAAAARAAMQRAALMTAAGMIDTSDLSTQANVDAAQSAIDALQAAIDDADDVDDTSMYQSQVDTAQMAVNIAQQALNTATDLAMRRMEQMMALSTASGALQAALAALSGTTPTQAQIDAANDALTALNAAITAGMDLTDAEKAPYQREATNAAAPIMAAQTAFDDAEKAAMAATAAKLHAGIGAPVGTAGTPAATDLIAGYNAAETAIEVSIGDGANTPTPVTLSEDEDTMVADNHGWEGKRYADPAGGDEYEAVVYSNVEEPTMGRKFGSADAVANPPTGDFQYQLTNGALGIDTTQTGVAARVDSPNFDQSVGSKEFPLPDPNPGGATMISVPGSYHGVSGTYSCIPTNATTNCSATLAAMGFTLAGGAWTFRPGDANDRVTSTDDTAYASYGWWIRKAEDGSAFTASAFHDFKGTAGTVDIADLVAGTATYVGGAAGKYALQSSTGGTNDAGHFTADATLSADFSDDTITGTIDNFTGADDEPRNWSVALNASTISDAGVIAGDPDTSGDTAAQMTVWTIDGTAADDAGSWSGNLREEGDDGVPKVATGTFYSTYGTAGNMVGAFGANKE